MSNDVQGDVPLERIDAHHHLWDLEVRPQPWTAGLPALARSFLLTDLLPRLDAAGVTRSVVVQTVPELDETYELLEVAAGEPRVAGVVGWFDVTDPDVADEIAQARAARGGEFLVAARHQVEFEPDGSWLARPDVHRGLVGVGEQGLVWDLVVSQDQLPQVISAVRSLPGTRFVLDHAGKPPIAAGDLEDWRRLIAVLAGCPNVAVKLSGLVTVADPAAWRVEDLRPVAEHLLECFSAERVMFGSDWPVSLVAGADYAKVVEVADALLAGCTPQERQAVWSQTVRHWYRLA